jgi:TPR repeat protein
MKYYEMAINHSNETAMYNLGLYYEKQKDYEKMIKYYEIAISFSYVEAITRLSNYYLSIKNHEKIIYYYWIALDNGIINIVYKFMDYLIKYKSNIFNIFEIYYVCCNNVQYNDEQLRILKDKMNLTNIQIIKYIEQRFRKIYKLIKNYIKLYEIADLICDF